MIKIYLIDGLPPIVYSDKMSIENAPISDAKLWFSNEPVEVHDYRTGGKQETPDNILVTDAGFDLRGFTFTGINDD